LPKSCGDEGRSDGGDESGSDVDTGKWSIWWSAVSTKMNNAPADDTDGAEVGITDAGYLTTNPIILIGEDEGTETSSKDLSIRGGVEV